jgi:tetratricopeptide (TPR) repeat protein
LALEESNPIAMDTILDLDVKLKIHHDYLEKAKDQNDDLKQIYGNLYLYYDYEGVENFIEAQRYLLEARAIAEKSGNSGGLGWVYYRNGVIYLRTSNEEEAVAAYLKAVPLCQAGGDSLCVGECYEQLSAMNAVLGNYDIAQQYFDKALPLLKEYGEPKNLCAAFANYGSLVSMTGNPAKAISYFEQSIAYCNEIEKFLASAKTMNNMADAYRRMGESDKAINKYKESIAFNKEHGYVENLVKNYMGLHIVYNEKGNFKLANEYLIKRYQLRDSISGEETKVKLYKLEADFKSKQQELDLEINRGELAAAESRIQNFYTIVIFLFILGLLLFWIYNKRQEQTKIELKQNRDNLDELTKTLIRKNTAIKQLEDQVSSLNMSNPVEIDVENEEDVNLSQAILTADDWVSFKSNFEKTYPTYIVRLRSTFPSLSEAEERLFLLLKLSLTKNEIATILGISPDTVKKTRSRLRKRLNMETKASLEKFIVNF